MQIPSPGLPPLGPFDFLDMLGPCRRVCCKEGELQDIAIVDHADLGRLLFLDGSLQSAAVDEHRYHEFLIHPAVFVHNEVRRVLVGGAGEGATLRELLRHPRIDRIVAVDIDGLLVELVREHMPVWHAGAFDDPRVELRIESIVDTVAAAPDRSFDLAVLDLTDPEGESDIAFLDDAFFTDLRRVLGPHGLLVMQAGELHPEVAHEARPVIARLRRAFDWVDFGALHITSFGTTWGFSFAGARPRTLLPADLELRLHGADMASRLRAYSPPAHRRFVTTGARVTAELGL